MLESSSASRRLRRAESPRVATGERVRAAAVRPRPRPLPRPFVRLSLLTDLPLVGPREFVSSSLRSPSRSRERDLEVERSGERRSRFAVLAERLEEEAEADDERSGDAWREERSGDAWRSRFAVLAERRRRVRSMRTEVGGVGDLDRGRPSGEEGASSDNDGDGDEEEGTGAGAGAGSVDSEGRDAQHFWRKSSVSREADVQNFCLSLMGVLFFLGRLLCFDGWCLMFVRKSGKSCLGAVRVEAPAIEG